MNKSFISVIGKFCFLSLLTCQSALAFNKAGDISLTAGGGYDYFSTKRHIENSGIPFGIVGYNFSDHWGIEGLLGMFHTDSHYPGDEGKEVSGTMFAVDAVYHFSPYQFVQPYVLAGPGIMGLNPNGSDANNEGNINAAVGVQLFVNEIVAFRFEARDLYTFVGGKNDIFLSAGVTFLIAG
jgi:OOP family OmpA-OmpF porin